MLALPAFLFAATVVAANGSATCTGVAPAIDNVTSEIVNRTADLNTIAVHIVVSNHGSAGQKSNLLQSVAIYQDRTKVDQKGVPPLAPGQSYTVTYRFDRSVEAKARTTNFTFRLVQVKNATGICDASGSVYRISV